MAVGLQRFEAVRTSNLEAYTLDDLLLDGSVTELQCGMT